MQGSNEPQKFPKWERHILAVADTRSNLYSHAFGRIFAARMKGLRSFATKSHMIAMTKRNVENMIKSDKVVIFSKSGCCHSEAAKRFFNDINTKFTAIELDRREDGPIIQTHLSSTGSPLTPRIYIVGKSIGGYYELMALHQNGTLLRLLNNDP